MSLKDRWKKAMLNPRLPKDAHLKPIDTKKETDNV